MLVSISFIVSGIVAWGSTNSYFLSLRGGRKKGRVRGREKSAKEGKMKGSLPSLPNPSPFFPSSLSPTPFDACYAGYYFLGG